MENNSILIALPANSTTLPANPMSKLTAEIESLTEEDIKKYRFFNLRNDFELSYSGSEFKRCEALIRHFLNLSDNYHLHASVVEKVLAACYASMKYRSAILLSLKNNSSIRSLVDNYHVNFSIIKYWQKKESEKQTKEHSHCS